MKIRNGFVSNSSSSNFIVALKDKDNKKIKVSLEIDLDNYIHKVIDNVEDLYNYYIDRMYFVDDKESIKKDEGYIKAKQAIEAGKVIAIGDFDDQSSDGIEYILCRNGLEKLAEKDGNVDVIFNEAEY